MKQEGRERHAHEKSWLRRKQEDASALIDARIAELGDWRGEMLARIRAIVRAADPDIVETWKWRGVPVWEHDGIISTGETYKTAVKMTFAKGALLSSFRPFNSSLDGNVRRAIDFHEGDTIDETALEGIDPRRRRAECGERQEKGYCSIVLTMPPALPK